MSSPTLPPELDPRGPRRPHGPRRPAAARAGRRWPLLAMGALSAGVLVFSVLGSGIAGYYERQVNRVDVISGSGSSDGAQNYLLVGSDNRAGLSAAQIAHLHVGNATAANASGRRSDTMILLHLSAGSDQATLVSLPRDSYVAIPPYTDDQGHHHAQSHNKLNAAYELGGAKLAVQTVELATGLHIDHYVEVGFGGFVKMVDTLGGVAVCSTRALHDPKSGLDLKAGTTTLGGAQALAYVRARYVDATADLGRMKRQQAFLGSLFRTALSSQVLLNPLKLNAFLSATLSSVTLDSGLTREDLLGLATRTRGLSPSNVVFLTVPLGNVDYRPGGGLGSTVLWDHAKASALFAAIKADQAIDGQSKPAGGTVATGTPVAIAPSHITVQVENGAGVTGLGARAAGDLGKLGFVLAGPATNAAVKTVTATVIEYDPRYDTSLKTLQAAFPDAQVKAVKKLGRVFLVVVGSGYQAPKPVVASAAGASSSPSGSGGVKTTSAAESVCKPA